MIDTTNIATLIEIATEAGVCFDVRYKGEVTFISQDALVRFARALLAASADQKPDCGACPGDGTICPTTCKLADDSPPCALTPDAGIQPAITQADAEIFKLPYIGPMLPNLNTGKIELLPNQYRGSLQRYARRALRDFVASGGMRDTSDNSSGSPSQKGVDLDSQAVAPVEPDLKAAREAMERAKKLRIWDDINHALHIELDIIFKALAAPSTPAVNTGKTVAQLVDGTLAAGNGVAPRVEGWESVDAQAPPTNAGGQPELNGPHPDHAEAIQWEGNTRLVIAPDDYAELWEAAHRHTAASAGTQPDAQGPAVNDLLALLERIETAVSFAFIPNERESAVVDAALEQVRAVLQGRPTAPNAGQVWVRYGKEGSIEVTDGVFADFRMSIPPPEGGGWQLVGSAPDYRSPATSAPTLPDAQADAARLKQSIIDALNNHTTEMEGYTYFGRNPGVPEGSYEEVADEVIAALSKGQP